MAILPAWLSPFQDASNTEETTEDAEEVELEPEDDENNEEQFRCEYCDFSTDTQNGLNIHTGRVHGQTEENEAEEGEEPDTEQEESEEEE